MSAEVHFEETILRMRIALRKKKVRAVFGIDLRDSVFVANDLDWVGEPGQFEVAGGIGERLSRSDDRKN